MPGRGLSSGLVGPEVVDDDDVKDGDHAAGGNKNQQCSDVGSARGMQPQGSRNVECRLPIRSALSNTSFTSDGSSGVAAKRRTSRVHVAFNPRQSVEVIENCLSGQVPDTGRFPLELEDDWGPGSRATKVPAPEALTGYMLKLRPVRWRRERWQVRYFILENATLFWWRAKPDPINYSTCCGVLDLSLQVCQLDVDSEKKTKFSIKPKHGRWHWSGQFTGVEWGRIFCFDAALSRTDDETIHSRGCDISRAEWAASIKAHNSWGRGHATSLHSPNVQ